VFGVWGGGLVGGGGGGGGGRLLAPAHVYSQREENRKEK